MKRSILLLALFLFCVNFGSRAQVSLYSFAQSSGTYTEITGGTLLGSGSALDDETYTANPIGFSFQFNGTAYTQFSLDANGYISMGATISDSYTTISSSSTTNVISAMNRDLGGNTGTEIRYELLGSSPNQILVVQWKDIRSYNAATESFNFQIRLYETSNKIEVVYGAITKNTDSRTFQIGLKGATNTDYNNRSTTTNWSATIAGTTNSATCTATSTVYPANGQTYTWTVPVPCAGTPAPGNTLSTLTSVCPGANFTLSLQNETTGTGVTYQWESSNDGAVWSAITGANASFLTTNQTAATYYHCLVTCSGNTGTSNTLQVTMNPFYYCYCTSIPSSTADEEIASVSVNGATNANNCTTVAPGPGSILNRYSNFTTLGSLTNLTLGTSVPFSILEDECDGAPYYTNGCSIWIDFNRDGDYGDAGEQVYTETALTSSPRTITGSIAVPAGASLGVTGMRIIVAENNTGAALTPCMTYSYGETEDYLVTLEAPVTPTLGAVPTTLNLGYTASGSTSAEMTYALSGLNLTGAPGSIVVTAPAGFEVSLTTGTGFASSINVPYGTATLGATTIYVRFLPTGAPADFSGNITNVGGGTNVSVAVTGTSILTWCTSTSTSSGYYFSDFTTTGGITNISNTGTAYSTNGYGDYTTLSVSQNVSGTINFSSTIYGISGGLGVAVWVDWNNNGSFDDTGDKVFTTTSYQYSNPVSGSFVVPALATAGTKRMRIRTDYNSSQPAACGSISEGETEDYNLIVIIPTCTAPSNLTATNITTTAANLGWTETGSATTWQIEFGAAGFTQGTGIRTIQTNNPVPGTSLNPGTAYSFYVRSICSAGDTSSWSGPFTFTTQCGLFTVPYIETFETATSICWSADDVDGTGTIWGLTTSRNHTTAGTTSIVHAYSSAAMQDGYLYSPQIITPAGGTTKLSFWSYNAFPSDYDNNSVLISTNGGTSFTEIWTTATVVGAWAKDSVDLTAYNNDTIILAFRYQGNNAHDWYVDDITIDNISTDLAVHQNNMEFCDTLGWVTPMVTVHNAGTSVITSGTAIPCSYKPLGGTQVDENINLAANLAAGDSAVLTFTTPYHFNTYGVNNCRYIVSYPGDVNHANDTSNFTVTFWGHPVVNLGHDTTLCSDASIVLDAGNPGADYAWWNGSATPTYTLDSTFVGGVGTASFWVEVTDTHGCATRDTIAITWSICSGISENDNIHMTIMPNPNNGIFTVNFGGLKGTTSIEIIDINGKAAISETRVLSGTEKASYDLSGFAKGIYTIRIANDNNVAVQKIIVN